MAGTLYLIPVTLGDSPVQHVIPEYVLELLNRFDHFFVEDLRTARRYLKKAGVTKAMDDLSFYLLNEHTEAQALEALLAVLTNGNDAGLLSEAGVPAVADPGSGLVALAHRQSIRVVPLAGPSSILMALMASGMNGQSFRFHGYLPVKKKLRLGSLRKIEKTALETGETQIFMETPYRNMSLLEDIVFTCRENTLLCIAADISLASETIKTKTVHEWKGNLPDIHKRPAVFLLSG
ncbi:MAG: SAM-dependent methyltransferase [Bacteroides sp. SM23_62]|nr:MAG: SAM-dependent methyltransferase [Bacteroides sp. SM23_62]